MTKPLKLFVALIAILLVITQISCNNDNDSNLDCENIVCTTQFITHSVGIKDKSQTSVALDSFKVINIVSGADMTISLSPSELMDAQQFGLYPLVNDLSLGLNQEEQIQFKGFINNQEVISSNYIVSRGCCHIAVDSDNLQLTL